jgi:hypothetical protein
VPLALPITVDWCRCTLRALAAGSQTCSRPRFFAGPETLGDCPVGFVSPAPVVSDDSVDNVTHISPTKLAELHLDGGSVIGTDFGSPGVTACQSVQLISCIGVRKLFESWQHRRSSTELFERRKDNVNCDGDRVTRSYTSQARCRTPKSSCLTPSWAAKQAGSVPILQPPTRRRHPYPRDELANQTTECAIARSRGTLASTR